MAQFKSGDSRVIEGEKAMSTLKNTVAQVTGAVLSGSKFVTKNRSAADSDDDFTTPSRKVVKRQKLASTSAEGAPLKSNPVETPSAKVGGGRDNTCSHSRPLAKVETCTIMAEYLVPANRIPGGFN